MQIYFSIATFLLGLIVGSFLNCVIYRMEEGKSFLKGRSFCPYCKHELSWRDLIPIFSFLLLRRKCRYCKKPISWQYPLVELGTGILFVLGLLFVFNSGIWDFICYLLVSSFFVLIFVFDLKHYIIPDRLVWPAILIAFLYQWNLYQWNFLEMKNLALGVLPAFFILAIIIVSRGKWMGLGDFSLTILMGLFLGFPKILVALFFAFFLGAIIGISLMIFKGKTLKSEIPFGPFLITATFISFFWGQQIINGYLRFLFNP
ncbi:MAG: prepilin peptidase [Candidatus Pacebacteria bacterium]|nr:prepilin peptidase [Candidatus Paceibacterota bacterium]